MVNEILNRDTDFLSNEGTILWNTFSTVDSIRTTAINRCPMHMLNEA